MSFLGHIFVRAKGTAWSHSGNFTSIFEFWLVAENEVARGDVKSFSGRPAGIIQVDWYFLSYIPGTTMLAPLSSTFHDNMKGA